MDWNDLRVFLAVAHCGTLSAASAELGVSPSTVSRRVEMLEKALSLRLFKPHRDGYHLTPEGRSLIPTAERAAAQISTFERDATGTSRKIVTIRIEAPELLGQELLLPALGPFLAENSDIRIDLRGSVRPIQIGHEEADIILRLVRPEMGNYKIKRVGNVRFGLYASADYIKKWGIPETIDDLCRHRTIGWPAELGFLLMARWFAQICPEAAPQLHLTTLSAHLAAAKAGMGWAILPSFVTNAYGLQIALPQQTFTSDVWMLSRLERSHEVKLQYCMKAIERALRMVLA